MSEINRLYEQLLSKKRISISFPTQSDLDSLYTQLRITKSRYDKKYQESFGESLSAGKVIRYETTVACDGYADSELLSSSIQAIFYLGNPIKRSKISFTILAPSSSPFDISL